MKGVQALAVVRAAVPMTCWIYQGVFILASDTIGSHWPCDMTVRSGHWSRNIQESSARHIHNFLALKISQLTIFAVQKMLKITRGELNVTLAAQKIPAYNKSGGTILAEARNLIVSSASDKIQSAWNILCVQVTVHRDNLRINNPQDASSIQNFILSRNSTSFGHFLCPSSGVMSCTFGNWYVSCWLCGRCLGESGWNMAT